MQIGHYLSFGRQIISNFSTKLNITHHVQTRFGGFFYTWSKHVSRNSHTNQ